METNTTKKTEISKPVVEKNIADHVLARVNSFVALGEIKIPTNYSPENALKSAYLILMETVDKNDKSVLTTCTKESIANTLLDMVIQGLSPVKKQCAFIARGNKLTLQLEYHGIMMLAKRHGNVKDVFANIIYENDNFIYEIEPHTGLKKIIKHEQDFCNVDTNKILGAYAVVLRNDGTSYLEIMNMNQIRAAWNKGAMKGNSPAHKDFPDQMSLKTVIGRACKLFISSSDDIGAFADDDGIDPVYDNSKKMIAESANKTELSFTDKGLEETVIDAQTGEIRTETKPQDQSEMGF